jgi:hypothetical protein
MAEVENNYRYYYDEERSWDYSTDVRNVWYTFHFDTEGEALLFRLTFSEYVKDITDLHPTRGDEYEKTSYNKKH